MICPACGSEVNVCAPEDPDPDPPDGPDPAAPADAPGTTTEYEPALPSIAFSWVCEVSDPRFTVATPVAYALPDPAGFAALNTPAASAPATPAAASTTTTRTTIQPRRRRWRPGTTGPSAWSRASVLLIALRHPSVRSEL